MNIKTFPTESIRSLRILLFATMILIMNTTMLRAQPKVIAHRGFWKTAGSAQNSLASLIKADSIHCYGAEFDVWLTADGKLVVNHDPSFQKHIMEKSTFSELTALRLNNGETLPSLESYCREAQKLPKLHLILELKKLSTSERETEAVEKIVDTIRRYGLEDRTDYISFSLHAVKEFIRVAPHSPVYYLEGDLSPEQLKKIGCTGLDYSLSVIKRYPEWIEQAHKLGLKVNVWTVNKEKNMEWLINKKVDFITTDRPLLLQSLLKERYPHLSCCKK